MNKFLTITIDVEPDCTPSWRYSSPLAFEGVYTGIRERLHPLFQEFGFPPTYLINNVVLEDSRSCATLAELRGSFELGTHLHPEFIEPEKIFHDYAGKKGEANGCFLREEVEFRKIENITQLFKNQFGFDPISFRAGRFSAGSNTIKSLQRLGYRVDTSVTPNVLWDDKTRERPVDYLDASVQPYLIGPDSIKDADPSGEILQVPVSIVRRRSSLLYELKRTKFGRNGKMKSTRPQWLRPVYSSTKQMIDVIGQIEKDYASRETIVFNMMFHNVEVMPGLSPYSITEKDSQRYLLQLREILSYCNANNIQGLKLQDAYEHFK